MSQFNEIDFTADDLKSPGWAASILLGAFRKVPEALSLSVLSHIDAMVEESANEVIREITKTPTATLRDSLQSSDDGERHMAMLAVESALWKFSYEFNGFVELYGRARNSLIDQQFGVLSQLTMGAMQRLTALEAMLPQPLSNSVTAMMDAIRTNKVIGAFFEDFHGHMTGIGHVMRDIEDYSAESAEFMRNFVREKFSVSKWFTLAQSALESPAKSQPSKDNSLSI